MQSNGLKGEREHGVNIFLDEFDEQVGERAMHSMCGHGTLISERIERWIDKVTTY